ncbi:MAG TPA: two-component regulator propeller domain-containing protein [Thermoanaerobaculia bacterium]|nr:two-component regulator propeller domain-containing protein [Thermoanaerobaculia bacterium]
MLSAPARRLAAVLASALAASFALGLNPEIPLSRYGHDVWTSDSGLPQNSVTAIVQTRDGYLWLGTQEGLIRFDGVRFTIFDGRNTPALGDDFVRSLVEARDGTLWIGTMSGLARLRGGEFTPFRLEGVDRVVIDALYEDREGALWVGSGLGATRIVGDQAETFNECRGVPGLVVAIGEDGRGDLWVGGPWGAARRNGERFVPRIAGGAFPGAAYALLPDADGGMWVGTGRGLARVDGDAVTWLSDGMGMSNAVVHVLFRDTAGSLWIGTENGLFRFRNGRFERHGAADGLSSDRVIALREDREGSLWVGTADGGLDRMKEQRIVFYGPRDGLSEDKLWSVFEDSRGNLWAGTADGALNRRPPGAERFETFARFDGPVGAIAEDHHGALWVGTKGAGLYRIEGARMTRYTSRDGLAGNGVISILVDRSDRVWVGTMAAGVSRFEDGRFTTYRARDGLGSDQIFGLFEDRDGAIWIATFGGGVTRYVEGRFRTFTTRDGLAHDVVMSTYQDGDGTYWFATRGGLSRFRNGRFTTYRQKEGLFHDAPQKVLEDGRGFLWLTSNSGVFRVSLAELEAAGRSAGGITDRVTFGTAARMIPAECNGTQHGGGRTRDGRLWFATIKGLAMADPAQIELNRLPPAVVLEQVVADGTPRSVAARIDLAPGTDRVEFGYTGLAFRNPPAVRFRFRLEGFDREWVDAGPRRAAYYTNLPPGHYRFLVVAANEDGIWNRDGASIEVLVRRHFWQTTWFRIAALLAAAAVVAAGFRLRVRRLESRERLRTALVEAQLDALQFQLRPHFLFNTLNSVLPLIGADPERARQMVIRLGELLRLSLRSEETPLVALEEELAILDKYLEIEKVRFRDRLEVTLDVEPAAAAARVPTFLLQPLAENAIKHGLTRRGGRGRIWISARAEGPALLLTLRDNGPGLREDASPGIGLANTRRRLEALYPGAHSLTLGPAPEGGCEVRLRIPLEIADATAGRAPTPIRRAS